MMSYPHPQGGTTQHQREDMTNSFVAETPTVRGFPARLVYVGFGAFYLIMNCFVAWLGYWLMGAQWPSRTKLTLCTVLGFIGFGLVLYLISDMRRLAHQALEQRKRGIIPLAHNARYHLACRS